MNSATVLEVTPIDSRMRPARSETPALERLSAHPYSDLLIHHMGNRLADDITQGHATGDMFRTTPLWGVGQRLFFLHDGRTADLLDVINDHFSRASESYPASEANEVVENFRRLSVQEQQSLLDFLRSL